MASIWRESFGISLILAAALFLPGCTNISTQFDCTNETRVCPDGSSVTRNLFNDCRFDACYPAPSNYDVSSICKGYAMHNFTRPTAYGEYSVVAVAGAMPFEGPSEFMFDIQFRNKSIHTAKVRQDVPYSAKLSTGDDLAIDLCQVVWDRASDETHVYANITVLKGSNRPL